MTPPLQSPGGPDAGQTPLSLLVLTHPRDRHIPKKSALGRGSLTVTAGLKPQPRTEQMLSATS